MKKSIKEDIITIFETLYDIPSKNWINAVICIALGTALLSLTIWGLSFYVLAFILLFFDAMDFVDAINNIFHEIVKLFS